LSSIIFFSPLLTLPPLRLARLEKPLRETPVDIVIDVGVVAGLIAIRRRLAAELRPQLLAVIIGVGQLSLLVV
jgi:hypothetical protein